MVGYTALRKQLFQCIERELLPLGFEQVTRNLPDVFEKRCGEAAMSQVIVMPTKQTNGIDFSLQVGVRLEEVYDCLDEKTKGQFLSLGKYVPTWGMNLGYLTEESTFVTWFAENLDEVASSSKEAVALFAKYGIDKCAEMASMKTLAENKGPHEVQYLLQPYVLALAGKKAQAVKWIRENHMAESSWDDAKQLGSEMLKQALFKVTENSH